MQALRAHRERGLIWQQAPGWWFIVYCLLLFLITMLLLLCGVYTKVTSPALQRQYDVLLGRVGALTAERESLFIEQHRLRLEIHMNQRVAELTEHQIKQLNLQQQVLEQRLVFWRELLGID